MKIYLQNRIYEGDAEEIVGDLPEEMVDLILTSPPYDNLRAYQGYNFDFYALAPLLVRVLKPGGVIVWVVGDATINGSETGSSFRQALYFMDLGLRLHDTMIYMKNPVPRTHRRYEQAFEYMFILSKGKPNTFNPLREPSKQAGREKPHSFRHTGNELSSFHTIAPIKAEKVRGNVWKYATGLGGSTKDRDAFTHPAVFPEQLAADHILSWTNPDDLVLDPLCGSGTTCKMAKQLGRHFLGIDISPEYCEIARARLDKTAA